MIDAYVFCDGSFCPETKAAGVSYMIESSSWKYIIFRQGAFVSTFQDNNEVELIAALLGMQHACAVGCKCIRIVTDSDALRKAMRFQGRLQEEANRLDMLFSLQIVKAHQEPTNYVERQHAICHEKAFVHMKELRSLLYND